MHLQGTWTDGQTDGWTDGQGDSYIPPPKKKLCLRGVCKRKDKTKNEKRKKEKKANKQNKQKTTPNIIIYIVPGVGLTDFILLPKIVWKER